MIPELLTQRLADKPAVLGAWLFLREPLAAEVASNAGYDYVCIDMQHGLQTLEDMSVMLTAIATGPAVPIVRTPTSDSGAIGRMLDAGALGIIVPMVNTVEQAKAAVDACRYAPAGTRSIGPIGAGVRFGGDYFAKSNDRVWVVPMIETVEAVENVEAIANVEGVDALYVGPADLSVSLGLNPGMDQDDPDFEAALTRIVAACNESGIVAGIQASVELAAKRRQEGFRMITVGYDFQPMVAALRKDYSRALEAVSG